MAPPGTVHSRRCFQRRVRSALRLGGRSLRREGSGFTDGISQCQQVVRTGLVRGGRHGQPEDFPAAGHRERPGVLFAQIVTMRLGVRSQGAKDGGGVGIHVRQSSHRRLAAA